MVSFQSLVVALLLLQDGLFRVKLRLAKMFNT